MRRMETKAKVTGGGGDKKSLEMCYAQEEGEEEK